MKPAAAAGRMHAANQRRARQLPKLCGADFELGNFISGPELSNGNTALAARLLLREIDGLPLVNSWQWADNTPSGASGAANNERLGYSGLDIGGSAGPQTDGTPAFDPQDWGRKFLPANGGCIYIDLNHLELCLPEVRSAFDHVAATHSMLRLARQALNGANARLPNGWKIKVLANNSDGLSNSYGYHLNVMITREAWQRMFCRRLQYVLFLAAYQVSSIVFTGLGKVGAENGRPHVRYQLSQRADFFEQLVGLQTTFNRPIVNSRNESLSGPSHWGRPQERDATSPARLHVIFYDNNLCHHASLLKIGVLQIICAMIEANQIDMRLILEDPLRAVVTWSHDPTLRARASLAGGEQLTAVELQLRFLELAKRFVSAGGCEGIVPHVADIMRLWEDTLMKLHRFDFEALVPRLDWLLKQTILERAIGQHRKLTWESPEIKHLDHLYSSLDDGLYWIYERGGMVERVVSEEQVEQLMHHPPADTRAWTRAMLLRRAGADAVDHVDWDCIRCKVSDERPWPQTRTVELANPLGFTKETMEKHFAQSGSLGHLLDALGAEKTTSAITIVAGPPDSKTVKPLILPAWTIAGLPASGNGSQQHRTSTEGNPL
ncbi:MAG: proteasome accessory factor PafA2 family protein [Verrucomicrobia bacterium]|nr:proteasome accessory factor PafA2 family protein [Verrucomicrobiota bacterium]